MNHIQTLNVWRIVHGVHILYLLYADRLFANNDEEKPNHIAIYVSVFCVPVSVFCTMLNIKCYFVIVLASEQNPDEYWRKVSRLDGIV